MLSDKCHVPGAPQVLDSTIDLHEDLVEVPPSLCTRSQRRRPFAADVSSDQGTKPVPPEPDRLVAHVNAALVQQILDVPQQ